MAEVSERFGSVKNAKQSLKGNRGSGSLRRLKPDETLKVRFLQEPEDWHKGYYHWLGQNFLWCNRLKSCPGCKSGDRPKTIVLANAVIISSSDDKEAMKVVVVQMAPTLANTLLKFHEKRSTLLDRDYDLTREGSGMNDTVYSADPDDPKKRNLARFEDSIHDIGELIRSELGDEDSSADEDDEEPRSTKKSVKKSKLRSRDDDYEDDDGDGDEEEPPRKSAKKKKPSGLDEFKAAKKPAPRVVRRVSR